jgi:hypothetical protein
MNERQLKDGKPYEIIPVQYGFILAPAQEPMTADNTFVFTCRLDLIYFLKDNLEPKG